MYNLTVSDIDKKSFDNGYKGTIEANVLLAENEDMLYKCMCFEIKDDSIYWQRLILTNKKIIHLWKNKVFYIYLKSIKQIMLECVNSTNKNNYNYKIQECVEKGDTPYYLTINGFSFLLNNKTDAMTLLDEINYLICE